MKKNLNMDFARFGGGGDRFKSKGNSRGIIFLSSVFKDFSGIRDRITDLLSSMGFIVWRADAYKDLTDTKIPAWNAAFCCCAIENCDYFLGVYPSRYGSYYDEIGFTELEYHHAVRVGLPRFLYRLYDRSIQDDKQIKWQHGFRAPPETRR